VLDGEGAAIIVIWAIERGADSKTFKNEGVCGKEKCIV
jgi:hypothetical protein